MSFGCHAKLDMLFPAPRSFVCLQFMKAVEMKQVAEQDAERAKFVVMKAEQVGGADTPSMLHDTQGSTL